MTTGGGAQQRVLVPLSAAIWIGLSAALILLWVVNGAALWPWLIEAVGTEPQKQLAELVVPAFVGGTTLAVAIVAVVVSRESVRAVREQIEVERAKHRSEALERQRQTRERLAARVSLWFRERMDRLRHLSLVYSDGDAGMTRREKFDLRMKASKDAPKYTLTTDELRAELEIVSEPTLLSLVESVERRFQPLLPKIEDDFDDIVLRSAREEALDWRLKKTLGAWASSEDAEADAFAIFDSLRSDAELRRIEELPNDFITIRGLEEHRHNTL